MTCRPLTHALLALPLLALSCATTAQFSERELNQYGKQTYTDAYPAVFRGAKNAIENMGYYVRDADQARGRIVTNRKEVDEIVGEDGLKKKVYRQYEIRLSKAGDAVQVKATPALIVDAVQLPYDHALWSLQAEQEFWDKYFEEVTRLISYD
jgi:hypothetical protein